MLGLDAAGKTTILYKLHIGEVLSTVPTLGEWIRGVQPKHDNLLREEERASGRSERGGER